MQLPGTEFQSLLVFTLKFVSKFPTLISSFIYYLALQPNQRRQYLGFELQGILLLTAGQLLSKMVPNPISYRDLHFTTRNKQCQVALDTLDPIER